jgi:hypothetical protein
MYYVTCNKFFHNKCKYILGYKVSISSVFKWNIGLHSDCEVEVFHKTNTLMSILKIWEKSRKC